MIFAYIRCDRTRISNGEKEILQHALFVSEFGNADFDTSVDAFLLYFKKISTEAKKKEQSITDSNNRQNVRESEPTVRKNFPIIESIKDYKCSWCNEEFELIDAFKHPIGTYSSSDIYRLKNDEYQMNELEDLLELIQNEDESADGMNYVYSVSFTSHFYCSRRCATNR